MRSRLGKLMPVAVVMLWGSATVLSVMALNEIGPMAVSFWRWLWALPALWGALLFSPQREAIIPAFRNDSLALGLVGFSGIAALYGFQNLALQRTSAFNVSLLIELTPVFIALLAWIVLREPSSLRIWTGIFLGFIGAMLLSFNGLEMRAPLVASGSRIGDVLALGAALSGAVYTVYGKKLLDRMPPLVMMTLGATFGVVMLFPLALWEQAFWPRTSMVWGYLIVLGLGAGALGNLWWFHELQHRQAAQLGVILFVTALVAAALAVLILGDRLSWWVVAGGMFILFAARLVK